MEVEADFGTTGCFCAALCILFLPLDWFCAAIFAAAVHEICHYIAVYILGGNIHKIKIYWTGAVMESGTLSPWQELLSILAGPFGSLGLLTIYTWHPQTAFCGLIQGLFNLLPLFPLDGGRALDCIARILFSPKISKRICFFTEVITISVICITSICLCFFLDAGICPLIITAYLISRAMAGKIPCKQVKLGVQYKDHI